MEFGGGGWNLSGCLLRSETRKQAAPILAEQKFARHVAPIPTLQHSIPALFPPLFASFLVAASHTSLALVHFRSRSSPSMDAKLSSQFSGLACLLAARARLQPIQHRARASDTHPAPHTRTLDSQRPPLFPCPPRLADSAPRCPHCTVHHERLPFLLPLLLPPD